MNTAIEQSDTFTPVFDSTGLIACITIDDATEAVLMVAWMNAEALTTTLSTRIMHYWSRSRETLWRKGATSGAEQHLVRLLTDCDQDTVLARVRVAPGAREHTCHTGRASCFYREVVLPADGADTLKLRLA